MRPGPHLLRVAGLVLLLPLMGCIHAVGPALDAPELVRGQADPLQVLREGTQALDTSVRARALAVLIQSAAEPAGGAWAPQALYDPDDWVRLEATRALIGRLPEPESAALLRGLLSRAEVDPYVRSVAGVALARQGDRGALDLLLSAMREQPRRWQAAAFALPAAMLGDAEALTLLRGVLERGDLPLRLEFALDCGRSGLPELVPALLQGLDHSEDEMRLPMSAALMLLGEPKGEAQLRQALGGELEQRLEAVDLLDRVEGEAALDLLRKARSAGPDPVRDRASLALLARGELGPEVAVQAMSSEDRELRQLAAQALGRAWQVWPEASRRDLRRVREALLYALADPDEAVRAQAIRSLALVGDGADGALLAGRMSEEDLALRVELAAAMLP